MMPKSKSNHNTKAKAKTEPTNYSDSEIDSETHDSEDECHWQ